MSEILAHRTPAPILDIANVSKVFSLNGRPIHALKEVNLQIQKGEFICLIGASGCGKSTLLRIMGMKTSPPAWPRCTTRLSANPGPTAAWCSRTMACFPG